METLVAIAAAVALFGLLVLVCKVLLFLSTGYAWVCIVLIGGWVGANVAGILLLERLGRESPLLAAVHRAWSGLFFYTALAQGVVFTVAILWTSALLFRDDLAPPATRAEFVVDFVKGSTPVAALLFLGVLLSSFGDLGTGGRLAAGLYALAVIAVATLPWLPAVALEQRVTGSPTLVFWLTLAAYGVLSAWGMALYDAAMKVSAAPASS